MQRDARGFLDQIKQAACIESDREADEAARATLRSMGWVLDERQRERLAQSLPGEYAAELATGDVSAGQPIDRETFVGRIMTKLPTEALWDQSLGGLDLVSVPAGDEAERRTRAVFAGIKDALDVEFSEEIAQKLPEDVADWFREA